jgi:hypothetical protein
MHHRHDPQGRGAESCIDKRKISMYVCKQGRWVRLVEGVKKVQVAFGGSLLRVNSR